jgi:hypothetical protein
MMLHRLLRLCASPGWLRAAVGMLLERAIPLGNRHLQFGFPNMAINCNDSAIVYDKISLKSVPEPSAYF